MVLGGLHTGRVDRGSVEGEWMGCDGGEDESVGCICLHVGHKVDDGCRDKHDGQICIANLDSRVLGNLCLLRTWVCRCLIKVALVTPLQ